MTFDLTSKEHDDGILQAGPSGLIADNISLSTVFLLSIRPNTVLLGSVSINMD
jgi:hypothetical protein